MSSLRAIWRLFDLTSRRAIGRYFAVSTIGFLALGVADAWVVSSLYGGALAWDGLGGQLLLAIIISTVILTVTVAVLVNRACESVRARIEHLGVHLEGMRGFLGLPLVTLVWTSLFCLSLYPAIIVGLCLIPLNGWPPTLLWPAWIALAVILPSVTARRLLRAIGRSST